MTNGGESLSSFSSGPQIPELAPKGKRLASGLIDLVLIPVILGVVAGVLLLVVPEILRNFLLVLLNIGWMLFRDMIFSPGRKMLGLRLVSLDTGAKVTLRQAFLRNLLLIIPFVLIAGYVLELVMILLRGERLEDGWARARVVEGA